MPRSSASSKYKKKNASSKTKILRKKGKKNEYKKYLLTFGLLVFSVLFLGIWSFIKNFSKASTFAYFGDESNSSSLYPNSVENSTNDILGESTSSLDKNYNGVYSLALLNLEDSFSSTARISDLNVVFVNQRSLETLIVNIPASTILDMPGKFGEEKIASALALGMLGVSQNDFSEKVSSQGMSYVNDTLSSLLGVKVEKWVLTDSSLKDYSEGLFLNGELSKAFDRSNISKIGNSMKTNLSVNEIAKYILTLKKSGSKKTKKIDFTSLAEFDTILRDFNYNSDIAQRKISFAVLNATNTSGVASFGGRVAKNAGGYVIATENASKIMEDSFIIADNPQSPAVLLLKDFFGIQKVYSKGSAPLKDSAIYRADITLVLGLDILNKY